MERLVSNLTGMEIGGYGTFFGRTSPMKDLYAAIKGGKAERVESLLKANPALANGDGSGERLTPLGTAVEAGDLRMVELLRRLGADPNKADALGVGPVMHAIVHGHSEIAIELLRSTGIHPPGPRGWTTLMVAAAIGASDSVMEMTRIFSGAARQNEDGETALTIAIANGQLPSVQWLLVHYSFAKVRPDKRNHGGRSLLCLAAAYGSSLGTRPWPEWLARPHEDSTPQGQATRMGVALQMVLALIEAGVDVEDRDHHYRSPLDVAIAAGNTAVVRTIAAEVDAIYRRTVEQRSAWRAEAPAHPAVSSRRCTDIMLNCCALL